MTPDDIAARMNGRIDPVGPGRAEAFLSSPVVHNHAAFLQFLPDGTLACTWFGGTLEGRSDIFVHAAMLAPGAEAWSAATQVSDDADRSEQNPVIFADPADGTILLFHTAQPGGRQEDCEVRRRPLTLSSEGLEGGPAVSLPLPRG
ncbi:glycosyl hydrolase, partial [Amaricoccus sp. HAR-UPW-R2A-40]